MMWDAGKVIPEARPLVLMELQKANGILRINLSPTCSLQAYGRVPVGQRIAGGAAMPAAAAHHPPQWDQGQWEPPVERKAAATGRFDVRVKCKHGGWVLVSGRESERGKDLSTKYT